MAIASDANSPKGWRVAVASDATHAGATGIGTTMYQLDVDSVGMPSLNPNQSLDVRSGAGRTLKDEDVFQDNKLKVTEISLSGTLHNDTGHKLLLQNICADVDGDIGVASGFLGFSQKMDGASGLENSASSLTLVVQPNEITHQQGMELFGCVVTNFSINADSNTEGGRYKWSATLQSGKVPDLASTAEPTITAYANTDTPLLSTSSGHKVYNTDVVMNSFTATIDSPAVFTGASTSGYQVTSRGAEIAVTIDTQVKYDRETKGFINTFGTQTSARTGTDANCFFFSNNNAFGVNVQNAIFTNVALSEGDLMMLDCSLKAVDDGTDPLITFDVSA